MSKGKSFNDDIDERCIAWEQLVNPSTSDASLLACFQDVPREHGFALKAARLITVAHRRLDDRVHWTFDVPVDRQSDFWYELRWLRHLGFGLQFYRDGRRCMLKIGAVRHRHLAKWNRNDLLRLERKAKK